MLASREGILRAVFVAHEGPATIAGRRIADAKTYTGTSPGPTLRRLLSRSLLRDAPAE